MRRRNGTPCPALVWIMVRRVNGKPKPWERSPQAWAKKHLQTIARSPTPFRFKNPALKEALEALGLEWLTSDQISRIRECPAPRRKKPRQNVDRWFGWGKVDPRSPARSPKCNQFFWAWRRDQTTCDLHWWAASMLRVEKSRKAKKDRKRNALQLKDARKELKRVRRVNRKAERLVHDSPAPRVTPSKLQAQNDLADFRLLQAVWLDMIERPADTDDPERLDVMIIGGYVLPPEGTSETYRLSRDGLLLLGELRKRTKEVIR